MDSQSVYVLFRIYSLNPEEKRVPICLWLIENKWNLVAMLDSWASSVLQQYNCKIVSYKMDCEIVFILGFGKSYMSFN